MSDFEAAIPDVFGAAAEAEGFIGHAFAARPDLAGQSPLGQHFGPWGTYALPRFYNESLKPEAMTAIATLSLWRDVESARRFVYSGFHRAALARRRDWFRSHEGPGHVMWWVADGQPTTWEEGSSKLEILHDFGPTPAWFDFPNAFDAEGHRAVRQR